MTRMTVGISRAPKRRLKAAFRRFDPSASPPQTHRPPFADEKFSVQADFFRKSP